jgi:hypothetical protein
LARQRWAKAAGLAAAAHAAIGAAISLGLSWRYGPGIGRDRVAKEGTAHLLNVE